MKTDYTNLFIEFGLCREIETSHDNGFSFQRLTADSTADQWRCIQGLPYWPISETTSTIVRKIIIMNDYRFLLDNKISFEYIQLFKFLLSKGFQYIIEMTSGKKVILNSINDLKKAIDAGFAFKPSEKIYEELDFNGDNVKNYIVLDDILANQLIVALAEDLQIPDIEKVKERNEILYIPLIPLLTPATISILKELHYSRLWKKIACTYYTSGDEEKNNKIVFNHVFSNIELSELLSDIVSRDFSVLTGKKYGHTIEKLALYDRLRKDFYLDFSHLPNLKKLILSETLVIDIGGLEKCIHLREIKLHRKAICFAKHEGKDDDFQGCLDHERYLFDEGSIGSINNLAALPFILKKLNANLSNNLTKLHLIDFYLNSEIIQNILAYFPYLEELKLENENASLNAFIDLSNAPNLRKLEIYALKSSLTDYCRIFGFNKIESLSISNEMRFDIDFKDFPYLKYFRILDSLDCTLLHVLLDQSRYLKNLEVLDVRRLPSEMITSSSLDFSEFTKLRILLLWSSIIDSKSDSRVFTEINTSALTHLETISINCCKLIDISNNLNLKKLTFDPNKKDYQNAVIGLEKFIELDFKLPFPPPPHLKQIEISHSESKLLGESINDNIDNFKFKFKGCKAPESPKILSAKIDKSFSKMRSFSRITISDGFVSKPTLNVTIYLKLHPASRYIISAGFYRTKIRDAIQLQDEKIGMGSAEIDLKEISLYSCEENQQFHCEGRLRAPVIKGEKIKLITVSEGDKLTGIEESDKFILYQCNNTKQYYVALNPEATDYPAYINYTLQIDPYYFEDKNKYLIEKTITTLKKCNNFPPKLKEIINYYFNHNKNDFTLLIENLQTTISQNNYSDFLIILTKYCRAFYNQPLKYMVDNDIEIFFQRAVDKNGVCEHRAQFFVIICQYFGIYARLISNDAHAYVAIIETSQQEEREITFDLGGSPANVINKNMFDINNIPVQSIIPIETPYLHLFDPTPVWVNECATHTQFLHHLLALKKASLLRVNNLEEGFLLQHNLINSLRKNNIPFVSINNKYEMQLLFSARKIKNNKINKISGPLKEIILAGKGVILINWQLNEEFNKKDLAQFKCLMDNPNPNFNGLMLTSKHRVIGIMPISRHPNDVFLSRCQQIIVPSHLISLSVSLPQETAISSSQAPTPIEVNLYMSKDWEKELLGNIECRGDQYCFSTGPFLIAIKEKKPLIIYNAPVNDKNFKQFWRRFISEGRIFFNGQYYYTYPGFKVSFENKPLARIAHDQLIFDGQVSATSYTHITKVNFKSLFLRSHIDKRDNVHHFKGLLATCAPEHQFIICDELTNEQWQRLYDATLIAPYPIHFYVEPWLSSPFTQTTSLPWVINPYLVEDLTALVKNILPNTSAIISTPDIFFMARKICLGLSLPDENIFYMTAKNAAVDLLEHINIYEEEGKIHFNRRESAFLTKLRRNETVILCGNLTATEYQMLYTLFCSSPYIEVNGKTYSTGKILWITTYPVKLSKDIPFYSFIPTLEDYKTLVKEEESLQINDVKRRKIYKNIDKELDAETYNRMHFFLHFLYSLQNQNLPITYEKYKALHQVLLDGGKYKAIKPLFLYHDYRGSRTYHFIKGQLNHLFSEPSTSRAMVDKVSSFRKNYNRIVQALEDNTKPIIYLVGPSGTSKTHTAKSVAKHLGANLYVGDHKIVEWLTQCNKNPEKIHILLLDEFNLNPTGKYEKFRGLTANPPFVEHEGKIFHVGKNAKILATGNTLQYSFRYYHSLLWEKAYTIWFGPLKPEFIRYKTEKYLTRLAEDEKVLNTTVDLITKVYSMLCAYANAHPKISISLRDIKSICARIATLVNKEVSLESAAKQAIIAEVADLLHPQAKQMLYTILDLTQSLPCEELPHPDSLILTEEKKPIWHLLLADLKLREERIKLGSNKFGKLGVLLEGESGVGKSEFILSALQQTGFQPDAQDPQKRYIHLSAGNKDLKKMLLKAFHEGSVVVLDELNMCLEIEEIVNSLLSGIDPTTEKPANNAGFMLFTSKNPDYYDGCDETPPPIINRLHKIIVPNSKEKELHDIASMANIDRPSLFVENYFFARKLYPGAVNMRNFFQAIRQLKAQENRSSYKITNS